MQKGEVPIPNGIVPRTPDEKNKGIMVIQVSGGKRMTVPYLGLCSMAQIHYLTLVEEIRSLNSEEYFTQERMAEIWGKIVYNVFWFEEEPNKKDKFAEV